MFVKDQIRSIYFSIRRIIRKTKNVLRWLPIIWKDEQWDYYHIYEILKHKLIFTAEHIYKHGCHINSKYDADRMMLCVRLIEKIQNEEYMDVLINDDNITMEKIDVACNKQKKAKRILFKLLENYSERWWD